MREILTELGLTKRQKSRSSFTSLFIQDVKYSTRRRVPHFPHPPITNQEPGQINATNVKKAFFKDNFYNLLLEYLA